METKILNGKKLADSILEKIKEKVDNLKNKGKRIPGLSVILIGEDPASKVYVSHKKRACEYVGFKSECYFLPEKTGYEELKGLIEELNRRDDIDGILIQLPLPEHLKSKQNELVFMIDPIKDVDGFHPYNMGLLSYDEEKGIKPCTPKGIIRLMEHYGINVEGKDIAIIGASNIVGKPLSTMLINRLATVSVCHIKTRCVTSFTKEADIVISATGVPHLIKKDMVKEGVIIIDVGITRLNNKIVGDADFENLIGYAKAITPVPGGVGPMTVAMLIENTLECYVRREGLHRI